MAGQPKPAFFAVVFLVVVALVAFAGYQARHIIFPQAKPEGDRQAAIDPKKLSPTATAEAPDLSSLTTVKEYTYVPSERLPAAPATSAYKPMQDNTVRFALNVWAGWAPVIYANNGRDAGKVWKTPDGKDFKVSLELMDNPVVMRNAYAAGDVHIGWATLDMVPLFIDGFVDASGKPLDAAVMPRIYQQIDWSDGGDGIVVRENIKTVADLRGKRVVLAGNSPSHYFLLNMLAAGGVDYREVKMNYTGDAFQAARAFIAEPEVAGAVSWAPDIYNLTDPAKVKGNRMLVSTETANKLIADVWFARADFARDNPGIIEGLVRGIFDAMIEMKSEENRKTAAGLMEKAYDLKPGDGLAMLGDAHSTNWAENYQFFMNENNPTNFQRVWNQAYYLYTQAGQIRNKQVPFDQVMDFSIVAKLRNDAKYNTQRDEHQVQFSAKTVDDILVSGAEEILTNTVVIRFYPNSADMEKKIIREVDGKSLEELYDPKAHFVIDAIGEMAGKFDTARIIIEGHTDSSMKGKVDADMVQKLSQARAEAVKQAVIEKFKFNPNKFSVKGYGWTKPADPEEPMNHLLNRRVEVKVFTPEATE
jgi:outer membrane protein OmpA-like peptidoglycan-associated protein